MTVLKITTKFTIGPASIYEVQQLSGTPLRSKRRMIGTIPQSHMGKISPSRAPIMIARKGRRGINRLITCCGTISSRMPEISAPITRNGIAS